MAEIWIAIVDDDPSVLKALSRLLRTRNLEARSFASARSFLAALDPSLPACLIVDLQMPGMTGIELQQHLRDRQFNIPVIVISAYADDSARARCVALGSTAFLSKPFDDRELFDAIESATRQTR